MQDSNPGGTEGDGIVNPEKLEKAVANWGKMTEKEQQQVILNLTRNLSPRHREAIINYLENLGRKLEVEP